MRLTLTIGMLLLVAAPAFGQVDPPSSDPPASVGMTAPGLKLRRALEHQIASIEGGQPDYSAMTSDAADTLHHIIQPIKPDALKWGKLEFLNYLYSASGWYTYEAHFDHAKVEWLIKPMDDQGKITGVAFKILSLTPGA